ncbi:MAG TPA: nucleotidyl transferase AbiEii/AbiGii toxin family protein [Puia sp.]|nr:nucleotidyl transferase AbiEii/AbiGii toxin family protein [Puia sp.]
MIEFLQLPEEQKRAFIAETAIETGMTEKAVEKDWWVTLVLRAIFTLPMAEHFVFKGGTSLSKGWGLIERLSEDIDIALAPEAFDREYRLIPTHSYVKTLKREGTAYTSNVIADVLQARLIEMGVPDTLFSISVTLIPPTRPDTDPQTIQVHYSSIYPANMYIADTVKAEFGVRALKEPFADVSIVSEIGRHIRATTYTEQPFTIRAVVPVKTLIEKILLLHEKFTGEEPDQIKIAERQSRHLADIVRLKRKGIHTEILADPTLFETIVAHRRHYVRLRGVNYDQMTIATLQIVPPPAAEVKFREDYAIMLEEMIYGEALDFDTILAELKELTMFLQRKQ